MPPASPGFASTEGRIHERQPGPHLRPHRRCRPVGRRGGRHAGHYQRSGGARPFRRDRPQRLARHALAGADGRGRGERGPDRLWAGRGQGRALAFRCRPRHGRRAWLAPRQDRGARLDEAPAAPHFRARRRHRPALDRRLPRPWRLQGVGEGAGAHRRRDRRGGEGIGPARTRRRRLPDRHQVEDRPRCQGGAEIHRLQRRRRR